MYVCMYVTVIYAIHARILFVPHDVPAYESDLSERKALQPEVENLLLPA